MTESKISFKLRNSLSELETLCKNLHQFSNQLGLTKKCNCEIDLVLEELFTNIISYGHADKSEHWIKFTISHKNGTLIIRIEDDGMPFNPTKASSPDLKCPLDDRPIGGLGVPLVKHLMNDITYERSGNKNVLTMKKKIQD
jgi:anti-sigma regulatory factor (Ser/Thr protein kinase)